jgi:hypothetical protein
MWPFCKVVDFPEAPADESAIGMRICLDRARCLLPELEGHADRGSLALAELQLGVVSGEISSALFAYETALPRLSEEHREEAERFKKNFSKYTRAKLCAARRWLMLMKLRRLFLRADGNIQG